MAPSQLLTTQRLDALMVEVTSTCNLRCAFCPKGQPGDDLKPGRNEEMSTNLIGDIRSLIDTYRPKTVLVSGTGETTFRKDWAEFVAALRAPGVRFTINTNLSLDYEPAALDALATFDTITVSVDSFDRETTRRMRSKCDIRKIAYNMAMLKAHAKRIGRQPQLVANATLTTLNADQIYDTWAFCRELGFSTFALSDLIETEHAAEVAGIRKWTTLGDNARSEMVTQINRALTDAKNGPCNFVLQTSLRQAIENTLRGQRTPDGQIPVGETRACTQPWRRLTVAADGEVYPCCVTAPEISVGNLRDPGFSVNGEPIIELRRALLEGRPPPTCVGCTNAVTAPIEAFHGHIERLGHL